MNFITKIMLLYCDQKTAKKSVLIIATNQEKSNRKNAHKMMRKLYKRASISKNKDNLGENTHRFVDINQKQNQQIICF